MDTELLGPEELQKRVSSFLKNYYLNDMHKDRESFYALTPVDIKQYPLVACGIVLNLIMDGQLAKADRFIEALPNTDMFYFIKIGILVVHPKTTWKEFIDLLKCLQKNNISLPNVTLTAGRPSILNGFNDFSRISPFLQKHRTEFIEYLSSLYERNVCPAIYSQCLAEYYYQINRIIDAEVLVSRTIKEFDKDSEHRLLFTALYLRTKILLAYGKTVDPASYIKYIQRYIEETGKAEFTYNLDSAEVMTALYESERAIVSRWYKNKAPDEFVDFNMLDTYRYLVKLRCYIIFNNHTALIALVEKLRPLLESGKRHMDLCEIDLLLSIALYRAEKKELALEAFDRALKIARRRKYYRLIADEGCAILNVLIDYIKEKGESEFLMELLEMTRNMAITHPRYLKAELKNNATFNQKEIEILKLLEQGKSRDEIAEYFFISENTVNFHIKKLYSKLESTSVTQAVWNARVLGII